METTATPQGVMSNHGNEHPIFMIHAGSLIVHTYYKVISLPASGTHAENRHMGGSVQRRISMLFLVMPQCSQGSINYHPHWGQFNMKHETCVHLSDIDIIYITRSLWPQELAFPSTIVDGKDFFIIQKDMYRGIVHRTVICYHPYLISLLFAILLSLLVVAFLISSIIL